MHYGAVLGASLNPVSLAILKQPIREEIASLNSPIVQFGTTPTQFHTRPQNENNRK